MTYENFKYAVDSDKILVGIEPAIARRFFTSVNNSKAIEYTGRKLLYERNIIKLMLFLDFFFAFCSIVLSIFSFNWYSFIFIPLFVILWWIYKSKASMSNQNISGVLFFTVIGIITVLLLKDKSNYLYFLCLTVPFTFLSCKLLYKLSTVFFRYIAINNQSIFEEFYQTGVFIKNIDNL